MADPYVVVAFFWFGLAAVGLGAYIGRNKERQRWRRWLKEEVTK